MIGVVMGQDDMAQLFGLKTQDRRGVEDLPRAVRRPGVDQRPAVAIPDQPDVDDAERELMDVRGNRFHASSVASCRVRSFSTEERKKEENMVSLFLPFFC